MEQKKRGTKSLMTKILIVFIVYSLISIILSTAFVSVNQAQTYKDTYKTNLEKLGSYVAEQTENDGEEFADLVGYFKEHKDSILIPVDYDDDPEPYKTEAEKVFAENYPGLNFGIDITFDQLNEDTQCAYGTYYFAKFLSISEGAMNTFGYGQTYFLYPTEEDHTMCYMLDFVREPKTVDGQDYIDIGIEAYEDPALYPNMWATMESGEATGELDSFDTDYAKSYAYFAPVNVGGETIGVFGCEAELAVINSDTVNSVIKLALILLAVMILGTVCILMIMRKLLITRITRLAGQVSTYAEKKDPAMAEEIRNSINQRDEISSLSGTVSDMITEIDTYMTEVERVTAEREKASAELAVATHIQNSALPDPEGKFKNRPEFELYATMDAAKEVGGDFYDFYMIDDDHLVLTIADVSGKGVPGAMFMMISKLLLKNRAQLNTTPSDVLQIVNNQLCENNEAEMFVTVWLGVLEISTGKLTAANAGHEFPAIKKADGKFELFRDRHGFVVAGMEGVKYKDYEIQLEKGDSLFIYTDGVAEATDANDELFGTERMIDALNEDLTVNCKQRLRNVRRHVDEFVKDAPQFDDITMLTLDYFGK